MSYLKVTLKLPLLHFLLMIGILHSAVVANAQQRTPLTDSSETRFMQVTAFATAGLVGTAFAFDEPLINSLHRNKNSFLDSYTTYTKELGNKYYILPATAGLIGAGYLLDAPSLKRTSWDAFKSIGVTAIATELLKLSAGRARPHRERGAYFFDPIPWDKSAYKSFPSGHTSLAFAFFTPFAEQYTRWLYILPVSVALSRVYENDHWPSDVLMGAGIGFLAGYFFQHKDRSIQVGMNGIVIRF